MTKQELLDLMASSKDGAEWDANCLKVKAAHDDGEYPEYWYREVVLSGLMVRTLGPGSDQIIIGEGRMVKP